MGRAKGSVLHGVIVGLLRLNIENHAMSGYTPDEKLRVEQLSKLRRQWLKDQELSPREPVLPAKPLGAVSKFWAGFLEPKSLWRVFTLTRLLLPAWIVHYYVKYHVAQKPFAIVDLKPKLFPGDTILETGEVVPDLPESHGHH